HQRSARDLRAHPQTLAVLNRPGRDHPQAGREDRPRFAGEMRTRRKLSSLRRASGTVLETSTDAFGRRVLTYDGIPVEVDDHIADNEVKGTSNDCSSIYAVQFGFQTGLCGLDNAGIQVQALGALETND